MNGFSGGLYSVEMHAIMNNQSVKIVLERAGSAALAGMQANSHNPGWSTYGSPAKIAD